MTTLNFATEAWFEIDASDQIWAMAGFGDSLFDEFLQSFDAVNILARARRVTMPTLGVPITNPRVRLFDLPFYQGPNQFLQSFMAVARRLDQAARLEGSFLLRLPGPIGTIAQFMLRRRGRPFAVQLVGDPDQVLRGGKLGAGVQLLRAPVVFATRHAVARAEVVNYVTARTLQARYPAALGAESYAISDVVLGDEWFATARTAPAHTPPQLFLCGSLAQPYKGVDLMIAAMALLRERGIATQATVAGDGVFRKELEALAARQRIPVTFVGAVTSDVVRAHLAASDLFVMPSRTEGMPRALIEAMAMGLPAVGSSVGGIVELLEPLQRFSVENVPEFADRVAALLQNRHNYAAQSIRNRTIAERFRADVLGPQRQQFYRAVRATAEKSA